MNRYTTKLFDDRDMKTYTFGFRILDATGRRVDGGHGFISQQNRTDAIKVAMRRVMGEAAPMLALAKRGL